MSEDQRSVVRQIELATRFAQRKGWTLDPNLVFVDDGISGAEFSNRPGFRRLMEALEHRAPFDVLIMSEASRLGREQLETGFALKRLIRSGARVFYYQDDREAIIDSATGQDHAEPEGVR